MIQIPSFIAMEQLMISDEKRREREKEIFRSELDEEKTF
jgi:hypothetical protein